MKKDMTTQCKHPKFNSKRPLQYKNILKLTPIDDVVKNKRKTHLIRKTIVFSIYTYIMWICPILNWIKIISYLYRGWWWKTINTLLKCFKGPDRKNTPLWRTWVRKLCGLLITNSHFLYTLVLFLLKYSMYYYNYKIW